MRWLMCLDRYKTKRMLKLTRKTLARAGAAARRPADEEASTATWTARDSRKGSGQTSLAPRRGREGEGASKTPPLPPASESPLLEEEEEEDMRRNRGRRRRRSGERWKNGGGERKQRTKSVDKDILLRGGGPRLWRYVFFSIFSIFLVKICFYF